MKILFLLKKNSLYGSYNTSTAKSGLFNSATITAEQLSRRLGILTRVVICEDANSIDREVTQYRPDVCVIEAIWVLPSKFVELAALHPKLMFVVRVHSEIPFMSSEGEAVSRIYSYMQLDNVVVAFNSLNTYRNFDSPSDGVYLPNVYSPIRERHISVWEKWGYILNKKKFRPEDRVYNIGCFGAIRPLKNQLLQAFAAIRWAENVGVTLQYHINSSRIEQGGESCLKNIKALFKNHPKHILTEHDWMDRETFLALVSMMDVGLQISFNESFNIVTADFVKERIPIVVSPAIDWMPRETIVDTELIEEIADKITSVFTYEQYITKKAGNYLNEYNKKALYEWSKHLNIN